ncbi:FHA domain-containing protein [Candidatus Solincola tengchongensis]|uniref:FHA domain-containing protein n=1 Tax=Candidatus Solincola tengchongensis TaxID=2900693 RepID=UPI00257A85FD|nr:FHA domain-containing protein [Candidatus Solincola tengchongensis]
MPEIVYVSLRYLFLALLYLFLAFVVRAVYRELRPAPPRLPARETSRTRRKGRRAALVLLSGEGRRTRKEWEIVEELVIGRAPECSICLEDEFVSNLHARIYTLQDHYYVEDLGSTNGTYVNGRRINYPIELRVGDRIKVGRTLMEFKA